MMVIVGYLILMDTSTLLYRLLTLFLWLIFIFSIITYLKEILSTIFKVFLKFSYNLHVLEKEKSYICSLMRSYNCIIIPIKLLNIPITQERSLLPPLIWFYSHFWATVVFIFIFSSEISFACCKSLAKWYHKVCTCLVKTFLFSPIVACDNTLFLFITW